MKIPPMMNTYSPINTNFSLYFVFPCIAIAEMFFTTGIFRQTCNKALGLVNPVV